MTQTPLTYLKEIIFHRFEHSSMPIKMAKKTTKKRSGAQHDTLITPRKCNISLSLTCPNFGEKDPNGYKYLKLSICHRFEHFPLPNLITKLNKKHGTRNYKTYSHHFYKAKYDLRLNLPKISRNRTATAENT